MARKKKVPWTEKPSVLALRHRSALVNTVVRAADQYRIHRIGRNAALISHYGFLSLFPLYLAFTTIIGLVLDSRPELAEDIIDTALARIPIVGPQIASQPEALSGSVPVLVIGLAIALWSGLRAFNVIQMALDDINDVPLDDRRDMVTMRLWSLAAVCIVGVGQVATTALSAFIGITDMQVANKLALLAATVVLSIGMVWLIYHFGTSVRRPFRRLWPGAVFSGVLFAAYQYLGTTIVSRSIERASDVYGTFATVIGLIAWLSLHSMTALLGAEMNRVLPARKLPMTDDLPT